jgi:hypothetical protein
MSGTDGKTSILPGTYLQVTSPIHGPAGPPRQSVAAILANRALRLSTTAVAPAAPTAASTQVQGPAQQPAGFGTLVPWVGEEDLAILAFINAHDQYGLCVTGVRNGDIYEHVAATGSASFSTATKNNGIAGLITVAAAGLNILASAYGQAELVPLITAGSKFAQQQFPESTQPNESRDPYGVETNGSLAREEGGVIVCEPSAQGIYHSGDSNHRGHWVQGDGVRNDSNKPQHIPRRQAFFLQQGMAPRPLHGDGDLFLAAWDWSFLDNSGFYLVHAILRRGHPAPA